MNLLRSRFQFGDRQVSRPRRFNVVVLGRGHPEWAPSILPVSPVWSEIAGIDEVSAVDDDWQSGVSDLSATLVIPFLEKNIRSSPFYCWGLIPSSEALETFADKARFAGYAQRHGLEDLVPRTFWAIDSAEFPLVIKRTNLAAGQGMEVVHTAHDLTRVLAEPRFSGKPITIQEHIASFHDFVTHCICVDGRIVAHCSFKYTQLDAMIIPGPAPQSRTRPVEISQSDLEQLERFLLPLRYTGPCNFNYRRRQAGRLAVLEINPRFGGSLFREPHRTYLRRQLQALADHAIWRSPTDSAA